ncbi:hypothetical protein LSAT2_011960 [Lamellibrachia satsuma]|nr:hypothetical protein LSAT2_011960 [Lamellibrachia satsuma]
MTSLKSSHRGAVAGREGGVDSGGVRGPSRTYLVEAGCLSHPAQEGQSHPARGGGLVEPPASKGATSAVIVDLAPLGCLRHCRRHPTWRHLAADDETTERPGDQFEDWWNPWATIAGKQDALKPLVIHPLTTLYA